MSTADFSSTVNFILPAESAQTVVMFLLSNKISFRLIASDVRPIASADTEVKKTQETVNRVPEGNSAPKCPVIESIYRKYIEANIAQSPPVESAIIHEYGITATFFKNGFKSNYGKPFYQLYMEKKMEYAAELLQEGLKARQVSERLGYSQPIKFNQIFRKHFGMTPKKYQRQKMIRPGLIM